MRTFAIIGSRNYGDLDDVARWMGENFTHADHVITGGAMGVDDHAAEIAASLGDEPTIIRPDWKQYPAARYGRDFAPKERNKMIVDGASHVVAFWNGRSTGTAHAIAWAVYRGKKVTIRYRP